MRAIEKISPPRNTHSKGHSSSEGRQSIVLEEMVASHLALEEVEKGIHSAVELDREFWAMHNEIENFSVSTSPYHRPLPQALEASKHLPTETFPKLRRALNLGALASGILSVPLIALGLKETVGNAVQAQEAQMVGKKEERNEHIAAALEGVGVTAVGLRSAGAAAVMASLSFQASPILATIASAATRVSTPLGILHAALDTGLGLRQIVKGEFSEGIPKLGLGLSIGWALSGGGLPALATSIGILGIQMAHKGLKIGHKLLKGDNTKPVKISPKQA